MFLKSFLLFYAINWSIFSFAQTENAFIIYEDLAHKINFHHIRAGQHDPSGINTYYFTFHLLGKFTSENSSKDFASPTIDIGQLTMESLTILDQQNKQISKMALTVSSKQIRQHVAQIMETNKISENNISIFGVVSMYEKAKKYYFFGEDSKITQIEYPILAPQFSPQTPAKTATEATKETTDLNIYKNQDEKGGSLSISIEKIKEKK